LDIFVHHGQSKALIALELQDKDIVLTTYGTLMAEFKEENHGPLLRAKWLRVVLDEGHQVIFLPTSVYESKILRNSYFRFREKKLFNLKNPLIPQIKNSRAKTFKAAANLDTIRKWIVSGNRFPVHGKFLNSCINL
jgi:SNF2 family DNA or RNA helicase